VSLLSADGIAVSIDERPLLAGIGLRLERGELVGLIGPNGAGKTTLLRVLANLQAPDTGAVRLDDTPLARISPQQLARRVAYLAQGAPAHWPLRVDKVVALGRLPHLAWWQQPAAADRAIVERAMAQAEVTHLRERSITTLSGGERMRVLLARIFAAEPELILADEPVAALDPYHQLHVMELLRERARGGGSVVAVLHDLNLAARFCDRLVLLDGGRLVCAGSAADVLSEENLRTVYGVAARVFEHEEGATAIPWRRLR
jgi:ABC-type cobalamin/Fe3+-siderophores transport system ATPase subunit